MHSLFACILCETKKLGDCTSSHSLLGQNGACRCLEILEIFCGSVCVVFSCINLGAAEGNASALASSKQFGGRKLRKAEREKVISVGGTDHTFLLPRKPKLKFLATWSQWESVTQVHGPRISSSVYSVSVSLCKTIRSQPCEQISAAGAVK